jgi:hypothetical protein
MGLINYHNYGGIEVSIVKVWWGKWYKNMAFEGKDVG